MTPLSHTKLYFAFGQHVAQYCTSFRLAYGMAHIQPALTHAYQVQRSIARAVARVRSQHGIHQPNLFSHFEHREEKSEVAAPMEARISLEHVQSYHVHASSGKNVRPGYCEND